MFKGLIDTIIGNLQLSISNVHIRYEVSTISVMNQGVNVLRQAPSSVLYVHPNTQSCFPVIQSAQRCFQMTMCRKVNALRRYTIK